jgi:hypothetical protein
MSDQPLHLKALDWVKKNPEFLIIGVPAVVVIALAIGIANQSRTGAEVHTREVGKAPAQSVIPREELLRNGKENGFLGLDQASNTISDLVSESIGSLMMERCLRWQSEWQKVKDTKSSHSFYSERLQAQIEEQIQSPKERLDLQAVRRIEIASLNMALKTGCRPSTLLVRTPKDLGASDTALNGALLSAIRSARMEAVSIDAANAGAQEVAANEAESALDRQSRALPVIEAAP